MIAQYRPTENDEPIIENITTRLSASLNEWYGKGSQLDSARPEIRSYRNCFMLRFPITTSIGAQKTILVKIRRNPKMDALEQAIRAPIHANIPTEYGSLEFVFSCLAADEKNFGAIRPLDYIEEYYAIVMEEYPSRTLRQLLVNHRSSPHGNARNELVDAASKTGRWLYYFHHRIHTPVETSYATVDILNEVDMYASRLETASRGRVRAQSLVDDFAQKLQSLKLESMLFSQSHADMTCDNVLYSDDGKVCVIDIKTRPAPMYSDLGLILTHPETFKPQIFSGGNYLSESILKAYRTAILAGYFENEPQDERLVQIYCAIKVLDKWTMYEELMSRYKGMKYLLALPIGPYVTAYFESVLKKHLDSIEANDNLPATRRMRPADPAQVD